jgi:hypothetical protein
VLFRTVLPAGAKAKAKAQTVALKVSRGPSRTLTVTASSKHLHASATIHSSTGKPVSLMRVEYICELAPEPTFCPAKQASSSKADYGLKFSTAPPTSILVEAEVGPVSTPAAAVHIADSSVVPAYRPIETVDAITPAPASAPKGTLAKTSGLQTAVTVKPNDRLVMVTRLTGTPVGAPQATTITIQQGPARSVTVSSKVAGGLTSTAVIKSATGSPIEIVLPHYTCFAAPTPTFCPAKTITAGNHRYVLTFMVSPYTAPPVLVASVQAG